MSRKRPLTALDLFSGAGGLTTGLKKASFRVLGAVEIDSAALNTLRQNHPEVRTWQCDIRQLPVAQVRSALKLKLRDLDLLAGCPPCQGFSTLRSLNGGRKVVEKQNELLFEMLRFARGLQPKIVMLENVPGLAEDRRLRAFQAALEDAGYECEWRIVDASNYGVPQRRNRLIFLGSRVGKPVFPRIATTRVTVRQAIAHLAPAGRSGDPLHDVPERRAPHVLELFRHIPRNGGSRSDAPDRFQLPCHRRVAGFYDIYGRMAWDRPAPTITSGCHNPSKGRFIHPTRNRAITLREAALLQTFPENYRFDLERGKEHAALMIGNALPPELIRRVGLPLARLLRADPS
ncbi:MAG: DNA cytosine methyltransferase [Polyangiaceae bacterium]|nr:DNA cytosine methyltransferase [Polyangiaceae bacterium]